MRSTARPRLRACLVMMMMLKFHNRYLQLVPMVLNEYLGFTVFLSAAFLLSNIHYFVLKNVKVPLELQSK